jgi:hypothetical protein
MDEQEAPLTLPAASYLEVIEHVPTQALQPVNHTPPTLLPPSTLHSNLSALLADIPSTIHVENLSLQIS